MPVSQWRRAGTWPGAALIPSHWQHSHCAQMPVARAAAATVACVTVTALQAESQAESLTVTVPGCSHRLWLSRIRVQISNFEADSESVTATALASLQAE